MANYEKRIKEYKKIIDDFNNSNKLNKIEKFYVEYDILFFLPFPFSLVAILLLLVMALDSSLSIVVIIILVNIVLILPTLLVKSKHELIEKHKQDIVKKLFTEEDLECLMEDLYKAVKQGLSDKNFKVHVYFPYSYNPDSLDYRMNFSEYNYGEIIKNKFNGYDDEWFELINNKYFLSSKTIDFLKQEAVDRIRKAIKDKKIRNLSLFEYAYHRFNLSAESTGYNTDKNALLSGICSYWPKNKDGYYSEYSDELLEEAIDLYIKSVILYKEEKLSIYGDNTKKRELKRLDNKIVFYKIGVSRNYDYIKQDFLVFLNKSNRDIYLGIEASKARRYLNHCWNCGASIDSDVNEQCVVCGWYICKKCGACSELKGKH